MKDKKILLTGASIAGPTLAYWLHRYGFCVTIVERAAELRLGGQNIDVKGPAQQIARKMGIEESIRAKNTTETGLRFVTVTNKTVAEFPKENALSMTRSWRFFAVIWCRFSTTIPKTMFNTVSMSISFS